MTNNGTRAATNVKVTDPVPARLTVTALVLPEGWTNDNAPALVGADNTLALSTPTLALGASAEIRVEVQVNPVATPAIQHLNQGDPVPTPVLPESTLVNEACVSAAIDRDLTNNCDEVTVKTKDIAAIVYTRCVADAALIGFVAVKTENLAEQPVSFLWTPDAATPTTAPASVAKAYAGGSTTVADEFPWVGTAFTPSGCRSTIRVGVRWRRRITWLVVGITSRHGSVMTPADEAEMFIFNGLILDPSELDYAWRYRHHRDAVGEPDDEVRCGVSAGDAGRASSLVTPRCRSRRRRASRRRIRASRSRTPSRCRTSAMTRRPTVWS